MFSLAFLSVGSLIGKATTHWSSTCWFKSSPTGIYLEDNMAEVLFLFGVFFLGISVGVGIGDR